MSDGTPWRPLIHVKDMARAIEWASKRTADEGGSYLILNTGSDEWNYQIKDLAFAVSNILPNVEVSINTEAAPDNRSYRVNFSKFASLAKGYLPAENLASTINEMAEHFQRNKNGNIKFIDSPFIRLRVLSELRNEGKIDENLYWTD